VRAVEVERWYTGNPLGEIVMPGSKRTLRMDADKRRDVMLGKTVPRVISSVKASARCFLPLERDAF
jgi:hypothetical protein